MNKIQQIEEVVRKECPWLTYVVATSAPVRANSETIYGTKDTQLSDILYVMRETVVCRLYAEGLSIELYGKKCLYNLTLPFKDQSEEVINFLHEIICKEK